MTLVSHLTVNIKYKYALNISSLIILRLSDICVCLESRRFWPVRLLESLIIFFPLLYSKNYFLNISTIFQTTEINRQKITKLNNIYGIPVLDEIIFFLRRVVATQKIIILITWNLHWTLLSMFFYYRWYNL